MPGGRLWFAIATKSRFVSESTISCWRWARLCLWDQSSADLSDRSCSLGGRWYGAAHPFLLRLVIRPVRILHDGLRRMAGDDLGVRVPAEQQDEFGMLARGFNRMAEHLQTVYATLEETRHQ